MSGWGRSLTSFLGPALALVGCMGCTIAQEANKKEATQAAEAWADRNLLVDPVVECDAYKDCTISHGEKGQRRVEALRCYTGGCYR
jgi:hypothetical protein